MFAREKGVFARGVAAELALKFEFARVVVLPKGSVGLRSSNVPYEGFNVRGHLVLDDVVVKVTLK